MMRKEASDSQAPQRLRPRAAPPSVEGSRQDPASGCQAPLLGNPVFIRAGQAHGGPFRSASLQSSRKPPPRWVGVGGERSAASGTRSRGLERVVRVGASFVFANIHLPLPFPPSS
ncbi:hypothetical protein MUG91_G29n32 [Manis pentadactyla]|nr:hypothetical protein MUG91_G29n32 [Manis pentadactyla]